MKYILLHCWPRVVFCSAKIGRSLFSSFLLSPMSKCWFVISYDVWRSSQLASHIKTFKRWAPDISIEAAPLVEQQEREQKTAPCLFSCISFNYGQGYIQKSWWGTQKPESREEISFLVPLLTFFCVWQGKGTKEEPYWLKTSRTVKQQDTTDRSCMAGIRIKVERAQRRKHTTKETGVWQTFFSFPFVVKRMEWKVWSYEKIERERLPIRGSIFSPVRLHADFLLTSLHERRSSGLWWPVCDSYKDENELFIILWVLIHSLFVLRLKVTYVPTIFNVNF